MLDDFELIKKYERTQNMIERRRLLSKIAETSGKDKAASICKLADVAWLSWYYYEMPNIKVGSFARMKNKKNHTNTQQTRLLEKERGEQPKP